MSFLDAFTTNSSDYIEVKAVENVNPYLEKTMAHRRLDSFASKSRKYRYMFLTALFCTTAPDIVHHTAEYMSRESKEQPLFDTFVSISKEAWNHPHKLADSISTIALIAGAHYGRRHLQKKKYEMDRKQIENYARWEINEKNIKRYEIS